MAVLRRQSFEGKDYDHDETWDPTIGSGCTVDPNYYLPVDGSGRRPLGGGAECLRCYATAGLYAFSSPVNIDSTSPYFRFYVMITSATFSADGNKNIAAINDSAANSLWQMQLFKSGSDYSIRHRYYDGGYIYASQGGVIISLNTWYRVEVEYICSGGTKPTWLKVYDLDGNQVGVSQGESNMTLPRASGVSVSVGWRYAGSNFTNGYVCFDLMEIKDDGYVGASVEQTTITKAVLRPASDPATINWTPSEGTYHWSLLNDDDDSTYIYNSSGSAEYEYLNFQATSVIENVNSANRGVPLLVKMWIRAKCRATGTPTLYYRHLNFSAKLNGVNYVFPNPDPTLMPDEMDLAGIMVKEDTWDWYGLPFDIHSMWDGLAGDVRWTSYDIDTFGTTNANRWGVWNDAGGVEGVGNWQCGGMVSEMKMEVFYGSRNHRLIMCPVMFGAVTDASLKVRVRMAKPWENEADTRVRLRYSVNPDMSNASTTSSLTPTSSNDYVCVFEVTGLKANTKYYFDVDTSGDAGTTWLTMGTTQAVDWSTTGNPSCKTFPESHSLEPFNFTNFTDRHHLGSSDAFVNVTRYKSLFSLCFGDIVENVNDDAGISQTKSRAQRILRSSFGDVSYPYMRDIAKDSPVLGVWDDHDFMHNDSYGQSEPYKSGSRDAFLIYRPTYTPPTANSNYQYGLWHEFKVGKLAHFFVLDVHYMSNDTDIIGGDHLDGTGSNTSPIYTSTNTHTSSYRLIKSGINFYDQGVRIGHVVKNFTTTEWAIVKGFESTYGTNDTLVLWWPINYSIITPITGTHGGSDASSIVVDASKDFKALGVRQNMQIVNLTNAYVVCRIQQIITTFNPNDTLDVSECTLTPWDNGDQYRIYELKDIFRSTGQTFVIYPSGGEDYGSKSANEAEGHYQREWLIDSIKNSNCIWKVIVSSVTWNRECYANGMDKFSYHDSAQALYSYVYNALRGVRGIVILTGDRHIPWIDTGVNAIAPECNSSPSGADFQETINNQAGIYDIGIYGRAEFTAEGFDVTNYCRNYFGLFKVSSKEFEMNCIDKNGVPKICWILPYSGKSAEIRRSFTGRRTSNIYRSRR